MCVADGELDADEAAGDEAAQELGPERLGLRLADVQADDLPAPGLVHAHARPRRALRWTRPPSRTFSIFASTNKYG